MATLPHEVTGDESSKLMVIFLHGWPDTMRVWD